MPERLERFDECPSCAADVGEGVRCDGWNNCPWCGHKLNKDDYELEAKVKDMIDLNDLCGDCPHGMTDRCGDCLRTALHDLVHGNDTVEDLYEAPDGDE